MSIGENIKNIRIEAGMEQKELAELLHISNKTVSSWECGRTEPKIGMIEAMSKIFNRPKSDFLKTNIDLIIEKTIIECLPSYKNSSSFDSLESRLWTAYLNAPENIQTAIKKLLNIED